MDLVFFEYYTNLNIIWIRLCYNARFRLSLILLRYFSSFFKILRLGWTEDIDWLI